MPWTESAGNLIIQSNFESVWNQSGLTITPHAALAPNGEQEAAIIRETIINDWHWTSWGWPKGPGSVEYWASVFIKRHDGNGHLSWDLVATSFGGTGLSVIVNLDNGQISTFEYGIPIHETFIDKHNDGWYHVGVRFTAESPSIFPHIYLLNNNFEGPYPGNTSRGIEAWRARLALVEDGPGRVILEEEAEEGIEIQDNISIFVESQFPDFYLREGPQLVRFIELYYEWLEQFENPVNITRKLHEYRDVDKAPEKFYEFLRNEFLKGLPTNLTDETTLLKNIKDFYRAKGSEKSYVLLFRIMFNEDVEFYYPGRDILRASAGRWVIDRTLDITGFPNAEIFQDSCSVVRNGLGSRAIILRTDFITPSILRLYLDDIEGEFSKGEFLFCHPSGEQIGIIESEGVIVHPGRFQGTDGFLSSNKFLQDNFYYQEYSYELRSNQEVRLYRDVVHEMVHPAGTIMFGSMFMFFDFDFSINVEQDLIFEFVSIFEFELETDDLDIGLNFEFSDIGVGGSFGLFIELDGIHNSTENNFEEHTYRNRLQEIVGMMISNDNIEYLENEPISTFEDVPINQLSENRLVFNRDTGWILDGVTAVLSDEVSPNTEIDFVWLYSGNNIAKEIRSEEFEFEFGVQYQASVFVKASENSNTFTFNLNTSEQATFDLELESSSESIGNSSIISLDNDWYYCEWNFESSMNTNNFIVSIEPDDIGQDMSLFLWKLRLSNSELAPTVFALNDYDDFSILEGNPGSLIKLFGADSDDFVNTSIVEIHNNRLFRILHPFTTTEKNVIIYYLRIHDDDSMVEIEI